MLKLLKNSTYIAIFIFYTSNTCLLNILLVAYMLFCYDFSNSIVFLIHLNK